MASSGATGVACVDGGPGQPYQWHHYWLWLLWVSVLCSWGALCTGPNTWNSCHCATNRTSCTCLCVAAVCLKAVTVLQTQTCTGCAVALLGNERRQKTEANRRQRVARACWASCLIGLVPHWTADLRVVAGWSHPLLSGSAIARLSSHCLVCAWGRGGGYDAPGAHGCCGGMCHCKF